MVDFNVSMTNRFCYSIDASDAHHKKFSQAYTFCPSQSLEYQYPACWHKQFCPRNMDCISGLTRLVTLKDWPLLQYQDDPFLLADVRTPELEIRYKCSLFSIFVSFWTAILSEILVTVAVPLFMHVCHYLHCGAAMYECVPLDILRGLCHLVHSKTFSGGCTQIFPSLFFSLNLNMTTFPNFRVHQCIANYF